MNSRLATVDPVPPAASVPTAWLNISPYLGHEALTSFAATGGPNTPIAIKDLRARLRAFTVIVPSRDLTLLDEVPIDGQATLQLKYW